MIIYLKSIIDMAYKFNPDDQCSYVNIYADQKYNGNVGLYNEINILDWANYWSNLNILNISQIVFIPERYKEYTNFSYINKEWRDCSEIPEEIQQYLLFT